MITQVLRGWLYHCDHTGAVGWLCPRCSRRCMQTGLLRFVPVLSLLKTYGWPNAIDDMTSGLSAGFLHLPQGLGFGLLASLNPIHGLYSSFFPVIVYMVFGTSPHVSMGTNAVVALLTAAIVDREAESYLLSKADNQTVTEAELLQYKVGLFYMLCVCVCVCVCLHPPPPPHTHTHYPRNSPNALPDAVSLSHIRSYTRWRDLNITTVLRCLVWL